MLKKVFLLLGLFIMLQNFTAFANPISDTDKKNAENNLKLSEQELKNAVEKLRAIETAIQKMDSQIEKLLREIEENNQAIIKSQADIDVAKKNVEIAEDEILTQQRLYDKRMRAIYMNGDGGYLSIVIKSKGISDLYNRIVFVEKMINYDKKIIAELNAKKLDLKAKQAILEDENKKLQALKLEKENAFKNLSDKKVEQERLRAEAKKYKAAAEERVKKNKAEVQAAVAAMDKQAINMATSYASSIPEIEGAISYLSNRLKETGYSSIKQAIDRGKIAIEAKKRQADGNGSTVPGDGLGSAVAMYAYRFLGTPYLWGGTRPYVPGDRYSGFDCSGLVQYCYAQFGIRITRTTYTQIKYDGKFVDRSELKPGDLIFFGTWADPHHVGMYAGNNCFIHAPQTGDVVKITPLDDMDEYLTAKRIVN